MGTRRDARRVIRRIASPEETGNSDVTFDSAALKMGEKSEQSLSHRKESMPEGRTRTKLSRSWCSCSALHRQDKTPQFIAG